MAGSGSAQELNLVPYLDVVTTLIIGMMVLATAASDALNLRSPEVEVPTYVPSDTPGSSGNNLLSVHISRESFVIQGTGGTMQLDAPPNQPLPYAALATALRTAHDTGGATVRVSLSANADVPYSTVVHTLDTMRSDELGDLYPRVALAVATNIATAN